MNLRDLLYLVALAEHRHFGKAADACCISQPTLSMQLKKLEDSLGVQLIERTNKSVLFTDIGTTIAAQAQQILHHAAELRAAAKYAQNPYATDLKLGIIPTIAPYLLPHLIPSLRQKFPFLTPLLTEEQTEILLNKLQEGKLDAAILAIPVAGKEHNWQSQPLFEEPFMLATSAQHVLAKRKKIKQTDLQNHTLLLLEDGHCLRDQALAVCQYLGAEENKSFRATGLETLRHMVAIGVGITLMPKLACRDNDGVAYIPFSDPQPTRVVGMIWRASTAKKILLKEVADHFQGVMTTTKTYL